MWLNRRSKTATRGSRSSIGAGFLPEQEHHEPHKDHDHDLMRALSQIPPAKLASVDESFVLLDSGLGAIFSAAMARRQAVERNKRREASNSKDSGDAPSPTNQKHKAPQSSKLRTAMLLKRAAKAFRAPVRKIEAQEATMNLLNDMVETHHILSEYKLDTRGMEAPKRKGDDEEEGGEDSASDEDIDPSDEIEHDEFLRQWARDNLHLSRSRLEGLEQTKTFRSKLRHQMLCWEALRADKLAVPGMPPMVPGGAAFLEEVCYHSTKLGGPGTGSQKSLTTVASTSSLITTLGPSASPTDNRGLSSPPATTAVTSHNMPSNPTAATMEVSPRFQAAAQSLFGLVQHKSSCRMRRTEIPPAAFYRNGDGGPFSQEAEGRMLLHGFPTIPQWPGRERLPVIHVTEFAEVVESRKARTPRTSRRSLPPLDTEKPAPLSARAKAYGSDDSLNAGSLVAKQSDSVSMTAVDTNISMNPQQTTSRTAEVEVILAGGSRWSQRLGSVGQARDAEWPSYSLRQPPAFIEPHREVMSTDVGKTPELAYLRRCEANALIPCPAVWSKFGKGIVDASSRTLSDNDVCAIVETAVERAMAGFALLALDLSYNLLTDAGIERVMRLLSEPWTKLPPTLSSPLPTPSRHPGSALMTLSFAGNGSIRLADDRVLDHLCKSFPVLNNLTSLDLSGIHTRAGAVVSLCAAIEKGQSLKALRLMDCGLGRTDQQEDCIAVAELFGRRPSGWMGLVSADLSLNFFNRSGFAAAAAAMRGSRLACLSFAGNASRGVACVGTSGNREVRFHPMQLLMEGLQFNTTIQTLDFSECGMGPDTAYVIEDALHAHPSLKSMDVSENPLGDAGLRSLVRLLTRNGAQIRIVGVREADATSHPVKYRFAQPNGMYRLNLRYPHERAILRTLLRIGAGRTRGTALRHFKFDARHAKPVVERDPDMDRWITPTTGTFSFTFQPPMSATAQRILMVRNLEEPPMCHVDSSGEAAITASGPSRAMGLSTIKHNKSDDGKRGTAIGRRATPTFQQGTTRKTFHTGLGGDHHRISLLPDKPSKDLSTVAESGGALAKGRRHNKDRLTEGTDANTQQSNSLDRATRALAIDWLEVEDLLGKSHIRISALRFPLVRNMFLSLVTQEQQSRFIHACSRDMSFNFTQVMQLCKDRPEMSSQIVRSFFPCILGRTSQLLLLGAVKDATAVCKDVSQCLWFQEGNLTGRYRLDLLKPAEYAVAESCLLVNAWESEVGRILMCPDVSQRGNYEMLRNESWNEDPFTYSRDWQLPSHGFLKFDYSSIRRPPPKLTAMSEAGEVTHYMQKVTSSSAIKLRALRAVSVHIYLSTLQFRNLVQCFPPGQPRRDFFCMFHTRVVDLARFLGPELLYNQAVFSEDDSTCLLNRVGFLHLLNPLAHEGWRVMCNLAVYEERMVVDYFVQLSKEEPGGRVMGSSPGDPRGPMHSVPASWADKGVPCDQEDITCCYETTTPNMPWRLTLAERYCVGMFVSTVHAHEPRVSVE